MNRIALLLFSLAMSGVAAVSNHDKLNALIDQEWQYILREAPEFATSIGDNRFNDRLSDESAAAIKKREEHDRAMLGELKGISPDGLTANDKLNLALIIQRLQVSVDGARYKQWEMPATQMWGPHLDYAGLAKDMPFNTVADYENYLARLRALPKLFEQVTTNMRLGMKDGLMPPRYLLDKVAQEAEEVATKPAKESLFTDPLKHFPNQIAVAGPKAFGRRNRAHSERDRVTSLCEVRALRQQGIRATGT